MNPRRTAAQLDSITNKDATTGLPAALEKGALWLRFRCWARPTAS